MEVDEAGTAQFGVPLLAAISERVHGTIKGPGAEERDKVCVCACVRVCVSVLL